MRLLLWGAVVGEHGPAAAAQPLSVWASADFVPWAHLPYNYPCLSLWLFTAIAAVSPTLLALKLLLTVLDAISAWLVFRITGDRWLALLVWALPASIWWVSREGQFEGAQSALVLSALLLHRRLPGQRQWISAVVLAFAVQVKLTAIVLLPLFLMRAQSRRQLAQFAVAHAVGYLPTAAALLWWPAVTSVWEFSGALRHNPLHWNAFSGELFTWNPLWMVIPHQVVSWGFLVALVWIGVSRRCLPEAMPGILFVLLLKVTTNGQPWYTVSLAPLLVALPGEGRRRLLIALTPLLDVWSLSEIFIGPTFFVQPLPDGFSVLSDVGALGGVGG